MAFRTLAGRGVHEDVVKGSRFVAVALPMRAPDALDALLDERRAALPNASHHVWALRWADALRWSDDGEPGGSAGRPVLEVVLKRDLDRVVIVVSRVFGGTKLGVGGLARAYGGAAARALDAAGERLVEPWERWLVRLPYALVDVVLRRAHDDDALRAEEPRFDADGALLVLTVRSGEAERIERLLGDATRGGASIVERSAAERA